MTSPFDASKPVFTRKLLRPLIKASTTLLATTHLALCRGPGPYREDASLPRADVATDVSASSDAAPTEDRAEPQDAQRSDSESSDGQAEDADGSGGR